MFMTVCEVGDVVTVEFPYSDLQGRKKRPGLVLDPPTPSSCRMGFRRLEDYASDDRRGAFARRGGPTCAIDLVGRLRPGKQKP